MSVKSYTTEAIRQSFLDFFKSKEHVIVPSSPLVLAADLTLLFANAGMNQFKEIFLGARAPVERRVADTQKCIRVSGKHNDLEEVGRDTYHHTFFEMLGNWSFGDYYKREAIKWAWELLTGVWGLPKERLWVTIFYKDDDAAGVWRAETDVDPAHILRFKEKDNFWEMGETGPCGPCSEIHFDRTAGGCTPDMVNAGNPDVMEIWNLVFIQYNRRGDGSLEELPAKHVDTGMGLERIAAVLQGKRSNYDIDLFQPILLQLARASGKPYEGEYAVAMRVIADHLRTLSFAIADGVLPSNEGRGYVLRRLLRRAVRFGRKLGFYKPFMDELLPLLVAAMGKAFPELPAHAKEIARALRAEEESFADTLDRGIALFEEAAAVAIAARRTAFPGDEAFKLYDTYGFPLDLTVLMAREKGLGVDEARFQVLMEQQRMRARDARRAAGADAEGNLVADFVSRGMRSEFTGYEVTEGSAKVIALCRHEGQGRDRRTITVDELPEGADGAVVLTATPFYPEKGGQVGDQGILSRAGASFAVMDTRTPAEGIILHTGTMKNGRLKVGDEVTASVDRDRRSAIARHHTATHLLQHALREVVGTTIKQAGSMVGPDRLRFDFNYFQALTAEQLAEVERRVNRMIIANDPVNDSVMALKDVHGSGIIAIFDEKYGETVRVIDIAGYSRELCGGTHVERTGAIGSFRILSEGAVAAGVRRIEALGGMPAYIRARQDADRLGVMARTFSVAVDEVPARVDALIEQVRALERNLKQHEAKAALGLVDDLLARMVRVKDVPLVAAHVGEQNADAAKNLADLLLKKAGSAVVMLGATDDGKGIFIAAVSDDLVRRGVHAGKLIQAVAAVTGGKGGGQPAMARGGAKAVEQIGAAIAKTPEFLAGMV